MMDLPVKLAVSFLIIGMMIPALMPMVSDIQDRTEAGDIENVCAEIEDSLQKVHFSSIGSTSTESFEIPRGMRIAIGGDGPDAYIMRLYSNGEPAGRVVMDSPGIRVVCGETFLEGDVTLQMRSVKDGKRLGVEVRVL